MILVIALAVVAAFACLYVVAIFAYHRETTSSRALVQQAPPKTPDYVSVEAKVISIDPVKENMDIRIDFMPNGAYSDKQGQLTEDMHLLTNSSTGSTDRLLPKDQFMSPTDITIEMEGTVTDYPWDEHQGGLVIIVTGPKVDGKIAPVPAQVSFFGSLAGFNISADLAKESTSSQSMIMIMVQRSTVIKVVVPFSIFLLWALTATVLAMVIAVLIGNKIEMVMFPFIGTILFSMVAFRNALPGAPPLGAVSDYLAFFWGYALCILALLALTITWLRRLPKKPHVLPGGKPYVEPPESLGDSAAPGTGTPSEEGGGAPPKK